jgi:hypothetical protein
LLDHVGANLAPENRFLLKFGALPCICGFGRQTQALFRFVLVPIRE